MKISNMIIDYVKYISDDDNVTMEDINEYLREYEDYIDNKDARMA